MITIKAPPSRYGSTSRPSFSAPDLEAAQPRVNQLSRPIGSVRHDNRSNRACMAWVGVGIGGVALLTFAVVAPIMGQQDEPQVQGAICSGVIAWLALIFYAEHLLPSEGGSSYDSRFTSTAYDNSALIIALSGD